MCYLIRRILDVLSSPHRRTQRRRDSDITPAPCETNTPTRRDDPPSDLQVDRKQSFNDHVSLCSKEDDRLKTKDEFRPEPKDDGDSGLQLQLHNGTLEENVEPPLIDTKPIATAAASVQHVYDARLRELGALQQEKQALVDAYATLKHQFEERSKKLNVARHERQSALEKRREMDDAYAALRQQCEEQTRKLNAMRLERQAALEQRHKADEEYTALRQKYEAQKNEYSALSNKCHSLKATLEQRTSELQGVQKFLATANQYSGSQIVNALRKLNDEVQQSTTFMVEWAIEHFTFEVPPADEAPEQTRMSATLGTRFLQLLGTRKHTENPILVEMAFRAYLIYELYWVASPWNAGGEEQSHNVYLDAIYERMREAEGQAISGNWRALTRAYTLPTCISDPELAHTIDTTIIAGFADILVTAGCTLPKSDVTSALWTKFSDNIHQLVSLAAQVNQMIGVGVVSDDFVVLVVWPDVAFDDKAMEDAHDNGNRVRGAEERGATVLCATEMGLMQRMRVGAGGQTGQPSELVVVKPKVALVSVVDIIDE